MNCLYCNEKTSNPKFCSRSCAATYNNTKFPKRKPEHLCAKCNESRLSSRTYCKKCWLEVTAEKSVERYDQLTISDMKGLGNAKTGGRYPTIRTLARKKYLLSDKPKRCVVTDCQYVRKFHVAHIIDIHRFSPDTTTISEVNDIDNLIALCPNHHGDFDEGYLTDPSVGLPSIVGKARVGFAKVS